MTGERIQKVLANLGLGSRREIESWVKQGMIRVNGKTAVIGDQLAEGDRVEYLGRRLTIRSLEKRDRRVLLFHKPAGVVTTRKDPKNRNTVFDELPRCSDGRWVSIGRLDINTTGLLLFTNDGELANQLMHPSSQVEREYAVRVRGTLDDAQAKKLTRGVKLDDGMASFNSITDGGGEGSNHWYHVVLKEGRNREVRRMFESIDVTVSRLTRVRYGDVHLGRDVRVGRYRFLSGREIDSLLASAGIKNTKDKNTNKKRAGNRSANRPTNKVSRKKSTRRKRINSN